MWCITPVQVHEYVREVVLEVGSLGQRVCTPEILAGWCQVPVHQGSTI